MRVNEIAAQIHRKMATDSRFGYSWEERWGAKPETWTIDGKKYTINVGDYDCSSSCITAWKLALTYTKYKGALDGATYTGNMREVFVGSGLFEWKPMSFLAHTGDLYLNEENHVAMCQTQTPDILSEFSWGDNGAYGNKRGDQTGQESSVHGYYDYPWDGILHYNGKADTVTKWTDGTYTALRNLNIRTKRAKTGTLVCTMAKGATIKLDSFAKNSAGNTWARVASGDHKGRFVCVQTSKSTNVKKK